MVETSDDDDAFIAFSLGFGFSRILARIVRQYQYHCRFNDNMIHAYISGTAAPTLFPGVSEGCIDVNLGPTWT